MSRDGPQAGRDELARVFALLPKHSLLHVGHDLEDDAKHVERPANVVLQVCRLVKVDIETYINLPFTLPGGPGEGSLSVR